MIINHINRAQNRKIELLPLYLSLLPQHDTGVLYQNGKLGRVQRNHKKLAGHIKTHAHSKEK